MAILGYIAVKYPRTPPERPPTLHTRTPISQAIMWSEHNVARSRDTGSCTTCLGSPSSPGLTAFREWLSTPCPGAHIPLARSGARPQRLPDGSTLAIRGVRTHPSHLLAVLRGWFYCTRCGRVAGLRVRLLGTQCPGLPNRSGHNTLVSLRAGHLPRGRLCWPDQASSSGGGPLLAL